MVSLRNANRRAVVARVPRIVAAVVNACVAAQADQRPCAWCDVHFARMPWPALAMVPRLHPSLREGEGGE